jgi:hypothetical protein
VRSLQVSEQINVKESGIGHVTRFQVKASHLYKYKEEIAGGVAHTEYWIPAEELELFNDNIVGVIEVIETFVPVSSESAPK